MLTLASPFLFKCNVNKLLWFTAELRLTFISICLYRKMSPALKFAVTQNGDKLPPDRTSTDTITLQVNICDSDGIQGRFLSISDHHTNSLFTFILCLLFISSVLGAVMCVVALLQCVEQRAAQLCSPTTSCSFHVVFFFLYLQSCVVEGQAYQRFSFFFSTRLIFKVCNSEDIFTVNAFFFLVEGEIYCHFYQCTV